MENPIERALAAVESLADIRYRTQATFLEELQRQNRRSSQTPLNNLFRDGLHMIRASLESRRVVERELLNQFRSNIHKAQQTSTDSASWQPSGFSVKTQRPEKPETVFAGTIQIQVYPGMASFSLPLNINNFKPYPQKISVTVSPLRRTDGEGKLINCISIKTPSNSLEGNASTQIQLNIAVPDILETGKSYSANALIMGEENQLLKLQLDVLTEADLLEGPKINFHPQGSSS